MTKKIDLQKFFADWGMSKVPVKRQEEMFAEISHLAFRRVLLKVLPKMAKGDKQKLNKILDQEKFAGEELAEFLQTKVKNFSELLQKELALLKAEVAEFLQTAKSVIKK